MPGMIQPMQWISVVAIVVTGTVIGGLLWWCYGRVQSGGLRALIAIGTAVLGCVLYAMVQTGLEELFPDKKINGDIIVYDVYIFLAVLVVLEAVMLLLRRRSTDVGHG